MSQETFKILGGVPEDPRIKAQLDKIENAGDEGMIAAMTAPDVPPTETLKKYGMEMRPAGLMHDMMLHRVMKKAGGKISMEDATIVWIFTACAPLPLVYESLAKMDAEGYYHLLATIHQWWDQQKFSREVGKEVASAVEATFELLTKVTASETRKETPGEGQEVKKNLSPGNASPPMPSSPSTDGPKNTSGGSSPSSE